MKSILVIPALNPPAHLLEYVDQLIASGAEHLVLVDDGSASEYKPIFEKLSEHPQCHILTHTVNQGKGRALKDAFAYILEQPQWTGLGVITADSDGQHLAADIRRMDQEMEELHRKEDRFLLLGCRNFHQDDFPFRSRFGNLLLPVPTFARRIRDRYPDRSPGNFLGSAFPYVPALRRSFRI